jgi:hypothetical protein
MSEDEQWNAYGCGPRCLMRWSENLNRPITKQQIVAAFKPKVPCWSTQCGVVDHALLLDIARYFGLALNLGVTRDIERTAEELTRPNCGVVMSTERNPHNSEERNYHLWLVERISDPRSASKDDRVLTLFSPLQDGQFLVVERTWPEVQEWMPTLCVMNP